jgi:hypothetical protein
LRFWMFLCMGNSKTPPRISKISKKGTHPPTHQPTYVPPRTNQASRWAFRDPRAPGWWLVDRSWGVVHHSIGAGH